MFEPNVLISSDYHDSGLSHEIKQLNNFKAMLKGVPPPSSITISKITVEDMLNYYKDNEKSFGFGLTSEKRNFTCSEENSIPFLNFLNSSCNTETIASLMQKVQERYIQLETLSSCNIWFKSILQSVSSTNKQHRVKQNVGASPGRRLSHLARRRQFFSCANLQQIANFEKTRQIEIKKNKYESNYKKITQNITFEKLNSSKRALFLSPEGKTPRKYESFKSEERKPFSPNYDENKRLPLQENCKKLEVSKWLSEQNFNIDFPRKRLRDECLNHTLETKRKCPRRSLNFENEEVSFSSNNMTLDSNSFSDKRTPIIINKLSQNHKNKLLWAVSIVLKENNILRSDEVFKVCASTLFHKCRKNLNEIFSLQTANGTSEKMLQYARSQISSVFQELNINFRTADNTSKESKIYIENNINLRNKLVNNFSSMEELKENVLENKVDEGRPCLLDAELHFLFKTPKKVSQKRTIRSCQKEVKGSEKTDNLKRCCSLESLIKTNAEISFSNMLKDLKNFKITCKELKYNDKEKLVNPSSSEDHSFEANIFISTPKDDSVNIPESVPSSTEHIENNDTSNNSSNFGLDLADKDFSLTFSPIPSSVKNLDSPITLFPALCLNSYNSEESFDCNNYTPNTEYSREISDQDEEMNSHFVLFASNENIDHDSHYLKFEISDNNSNEENVSGIMGKPFKDSKPYRCLETQDCNISAKTSNEEIIARDRKLTTDNFGYEITHSDGYINKPLTDSDEIIDKLTVNRFPYLNDSVVATDLNSSDQVTGKIMKTDAENECNLTLSSNSTGHLEKILNPSPPKGCSIEKGIYKPRKLVVKKSKPNWKVVRQNSEESENISDLKLKMRLSHEWEVIHRTSYSSDATNNSENEGNSFNSSQVSSSNNDKYCDEVQVESDGTFSTFSFHEDLETTDALNYSEDKLIQNLEHHSELKIQSNKISESKTPDKSIKRISLSVKSGDISFYPFAFHSLKNKNFVLKEDCTCLESEEINEELQKPNFLAMNSFEKCIVNKKDETFVESEEHNETTTSNILNEKHDSIFVSCKNEFINQNESEFQTDHTKNLSMLNVYKENLSNVDVSCHLHNEENKDIFETEESLSLFEKKVDENIKTVVEDRLLDREVLHERANIAKNHSIYDYCLEKKHNFKDYQFNNKQSENNFQICLESPTIFHPSNDCPSYTEEFETINQCNGKNSPSRYEKTDTSWEKDNSLKQLENCVSNLIQPHTEENENSPVLINSKPANQILILESYKTQKLKVIKDLERIISRPENVEQAKVNFSEQNNCNLKNPKKKISDIKLEHPISEYKHKFKYKDKLSKEPKNEHHLKYETNVSDNLNHSDSTHEKQINNIKSTPNDDSKATYDVSTNDKDKYFFKNEDLLKALISKCYESDNESNLALQLINLSCNKLSSLNDGERKTENINVQTVVSALSAFSTLVEEQVKLENEKIKMKQLSEDKQESANELENLKTNWLVSYWYDKNLNNLKLQSNLLSDSYKFEDDMNVVKHIVDTEKSQDYGIKINNLKKNMLSKDFIKKQRVLKYQKEQNYSLPSQQSDLESKNEGEILETTHSKGSFEEISSTVFEKMSDMSNFLTEKISTNDNTRFYMNETSHFLNGTKNSDCNYSTTQVNPNNGDSYAFKVPGFQIENGSKKSLSRNEKYDTLKCHSTCVQQLKPVNINYEYIVGSKYRIPSQNYFSETKEQNQLFLNNSKHSSMQSDQNNSYYSSVLTSNTRFSEGEYGRHSTSESSNMSNSYFQYSRIQTPMATEKKYLDAANDSAMSVYNTQYLMKSLWQQSNLYCQSNFSQNQQLSENFAGKFPSTLSSFKASADYGNQNDCASDVHTQFKSPNICSQKQSSMFYQFNNVCNVYSSWQFPPDLNSCSYKHNVLNDGFQNSSAFSYPIPNIPYHVNYFR